MQGEKTGGFRDTMVRIKQNKNQRCEQECRDLEYERNENGNLEMEMVEK